MTPAELRTRTALFARIVVRFCLPLLKSDDTRDLGRQLLRCGTSAACNYRSTQRARSGKEFVARLAVALEEADESVFWCELLHDCHLVTKEAVHPVLDEARQLAAIFAASHQTATANRRAHLS